MARGRSPHAAAPGGAPAGPAKPQFRPGPGRPDPELHQAVRDAFRHAMRNGASQRQAFDAAAALVAERRPDYEPGSLRRLVARMLSCEPPPR